MALYDRNLIHQRILYSHHSHKHNKGTLSGAFVEPPDFDVTG
jgi:hypothetical protein